MNKKIEKLLNNCGGNYILPFFWQHGEDEPTLRKYMQVIQEANIGAVCVESRPHPDYCGPKWWQDMDIILDEARKHNMRVWILDDSHFPTGFANGALVDAPEELCRQFIVHQSVSVSGGNSIRYDVSRFLKRSYEKKTLLGLLLSRGKKVRVYSDDTLLGVTAIRIDTPDQVDLVGEIKSGKLTWQAPEGEWRVCFHKLTRNSGAHRSYINMLDKKSCRVLIDAVYEPHFEHYAAEFGTTIAGFFSDEPQLGNSGIINFGNTLGTEQPLPWSSELEAKLENEIGSDWKAKLGYLWENDLDPDQTAISRYTYMDLVTRSVEENFSFQVGDWCRAHGVEYIGHVIEDNNQHARTGTSLGHFYRSLAGQDMAGIDDIGGQVYPQGEGGPDKWMHFIPRDGEFYHYSLAKLGSSHASIDPLKKGRAMCEIFGAYGWSEGLRIEKYLADHFMVRGINHYVPHAFSPKAFPDPDCPPHFYAHGRNPQYRAFGSLMAYMNRVCELISDGKSVVPVAILYHGEAEWTGKCMLMQKPAHVLADRQIDYEFIPTDVFSDVEQYATDLSTGLRINGKEYKALVIPTAEYVSADLVNAAMQLTRLGVPVLFIEALPTGIFDGDRTMLSELKDCTVVSLDQLTTTLDEKGVPEIFIQPASDRLRYFHYVNEHHIYYFVNEADSVYSGDITVPQKGNVYAYNAWDNRLETLTSSANEDGTTLSIKLESFKSLIVVFDQVSENLLTVPLRAEGEEIPFTKTWKRSVCESLAYPNFLEAKEIYMPDDLAQEKPKFSGFVRYENEIRTNIIPSRAVLEITDAWEGVELFVNGVSVGTQIVPSYLYEISEFLKEGKNLITIEVSTTLERERASGKRSLMERIQTQKEKSPTGITGTVHCYVQ